MLSRHTTQKVQDGLESLLQIEFQKIDRSEFQNQHFCCAGQETKATLMEVATVGGNALP